MHEAHRVRKGLNEWNRIPAGYVELRPEDRVQGGDVQRINDEYFREYPAKGLLVGLFRGAGGTWYRKAQPGATAPHLKEASMNAPDLAVDREDAQDAVVERVAQAMAVHSGWDGWHTATTAQHTPNGNEPAEEREYWRDMARIARAEFQTAGPG